MAHVTITIKDEQGAVLAELTVSPGGVIPENATPQDLARRVKTVLGIPFMVEEQG